MIFDFYKQIMSILDGVTLAFLRIILGVLFLLITDVRVDDTIFPYWTLKLRFVDTPQIAYWSSIMSYHEFNNPIKKGFIMWLMDKKKPRVANKKMWKIVGSYILMELSKERKKDDGIRELRAKKLNKINLSTLHSIVQQDDVNKLSKLVGSQ